MKEVVLGLDISTSKIGLCIMDYKLNLLETKLIKLDTKKTLEERCLVLENILASFPSSGYIFGDIFAMLLNI